MQGIEQAVPEGDDDIDIPEQTVDVDAKRKLMLDDLPLSIREKLGPKPEPPPEEPEPKKVRYDESQMGVNQVSW